MAAQRTGIADIPVELLIDNILPFCEAKDVFSLGCTNKFFALITTDDTYWKRRLVVDYNFTGSETARTSGWKFIYQRLRNPRVFVWGYVIFSFSMLRGCSFLHRFHPYPTGCNHSERKIKVGSGCHSFQGQRFRIFLFQWNFIFRASA